MMGSLQVSAATTPFRRDIQALRGYAVLIVLLYHAKLAFLPGGYLGVDIFFVISGFLITRLIKDGIEQGTFRFVDFYFRRAKRLLPAAYITFLACTALAPLFLTNAELKDFQIQIAGAVSFTGNIVLWRQSGYFAGSAELKPLLHVWSLAIEEQYYFLLPALMVFVPRRYWLSGTIAMLLVSLALCFVFAGRDLTFYLLPTRAWELLIGSLGALLGATVPARLLKYLFWPALCALLVLPFMPSFSYHPGPEAFIVCVSTLVLLMRQHPVLSTQGVMRGFSKLGDISYSLYLVHWPLFAFFNNAWIGKNGNDQPLSIHLALVMLSLLLAYLLNRYVEEPVRHLDIQRTRRIFVRTIVTSFGIVLFNAGFANAVGDSQPSIRHANYGFAPSCAMEGNFSALKECRNAERPTVLVWGDSFAMHLIPGLANSPMSPGIIQATKPVCGPILGLAVVRENGGRSREWAQSCITFNEQVLGYLKATPSITTVALSSPMDYYVSPEEHLLIKKDGAYSLIAAGQTVAIENFKQTVQKIRTLGKKVVVVAPPPMSGFDVGRCLDRQKSKLPTLGITEGCQIDVTLYHQERQGVLEFLAAIHNDAATNVVGFDEELCKASLCSTARDDISLYNDGGHLSVAGSVYLAKKISLLEKIQQAAQ